MQSGNPAGHCNACHTKQNSNDKSLGGTICMGLKLKQRHLAQSPSNKNFEKRAYKKMPKEQVALPVWKTVVTNTEHIHCFLLWCREAMSLLISWASSLSISAGLPPLANKNPQRLKSYGNVTGSRSNAWKMSGAKGVVVKHSPQKGGGGKHLSCS